MAAHTRTERSRATRVYEDDDDGLVRDDDTVVVRDRMAGPIVIMRNIVYAVLVALESILLLRFLLALSGANTANAFASFIYDISAPLVAPFRGLFDIDQIVGTSARFEYEVLVAMLVYGLIGLLLLLALRVPED